ncbi:MAG: hypothetical protein VW644_14270, partial [Alphaproteobacteria bacterium]
MDITPLLERRELRGVRLALIARLAVLLFALPVELTVGSGAAPGPMRILVLGSFLGGFVAYGALLYVLLRTRKTGAVGFVAVAADLVLMAFMIFAWWMSNGGGEMPAAYMLKTGLAGVMTIFIALNAIALRPLYPAVVAAGMVVIVLVLIMLALADPRTQWTYQVFEATSGEAVAIPLVAGDLTILLVVGVLVTFATLAARRLMLDAIRFEKTTAQL